MSSRPPDDAPLRAAPTSVYDAPSVAKLSVTSCPQIAGLSRAPHAGPKAQAPGFAHEASTKSSS